MNHLTFNENQQKSYKLAVLIKGSALRKKEITEYYVQPLLDRGFASTDIIAFSLKHNEQGKASVKLIKEYLQQLEKAISHLGITHVLVADAAYFKVLAKVRKAEPHYGYVLPSIWPCVKASLTINYMQLFYNPTLKARLNMGIEAVTKDIKGEPGLFQRDLTSEVKFPIGREAKQDVLRQLLKEPILTCDIETRGLEITKSKILSIAFGSSTTEGAAFIPNYEDLYNFLTAYKGKLIFHNATFDTKMLIRELFMQHVNDIAGMLKGLHILYRNIEDTKILAYLSTNSTSGNTLSLKHLAFAFSGNYALEEIINPESIAKIDLLKYNATDALGTKYIYDIYRPIVRDTQEEVYQTVFKPSLKTLTQTELVGMPLNLKTVKVVEEKLKKVKFRHYSAIQFDNYVLSVEKELRLAAALTATAKLKKTIKTEEDFADLTFNPGSHKQLSHLLYDHLKLPIQHFTDKGQPSTDGKAIDGLIAWIENKYEL